MGGLSVSSLKVFFLHIQVNQHNFVLADDRLCGHAFLQVSIILVISTADSLYLLSSRYTNKFAMPPFRVAVLVIMCLQIELLRLVPGSYLLLELLLVKHGVSVSFLVELYYSCNYNNNGDKF